MEKPNILWICTDQQRSDTLGCYGNKWTRTDNIDQLASNGALFTNAFSQSPVCTPSRGSFLTGRYPRTCKARQNGSNIPDDEILVTKILKNAGYYCGLSGKLHLSCCDAIYSRGRERRIDDGYDVFHWSHDPNNLWYANEYHLWLKERKVKLRSKRFKGCRFIQVGPIPENHQTTWISEKAISFINNASKFEGPWLFSVNIFDPHHPFNPPEEYLQRYLYNLDEIPLPNFIEGELDNKPIYQQIDHMGAYGRTESYSFPKMKEKDHRLIKAAYWAMCDLIDDQIGRIISALKDSNQYENTIIIFMSDHGELLGDHGIYLKGPFFYDPAIKIPLIFYWKNKIKSQKVDALVELMDLPQTLLDAIKVSPYKGMQGKSFWSILSGDSDPKIHKKNVYCEYYNAMPWHKNPTAQMTMIRTKNHKLTVDHPNSFGELYDLREDPLESYNLWQEPAYDKIKTEMLIKLTNRMAFTVDPLPIRKGNY